MPTGMRWLDSGGDGHLGDGTLDRLSKIRGCKKKLQDSFLPYKATAHKPCAVIRVVHLHRVLSSVVERYSDIFGKNIDTYI